MKKGVSVLIIILFLISSYSSANPDNRNLILVNGMGISVLLNDESQKEIFSSAEYSNEYEMLLFETKKMIEYIQLINPKGILENQFSVKAKNVEIEKSIFTKGKYMMGLKINGQSQVEFLNVVVE
jgi:hypothetical protein